MTLGQATIGGKVGYKGGKGVDTLTVTGSQVTGKSALDVGTGNNTVTFDAATLADLFVKAGGGDDTVQFTNGSVVQGKKRLALGGGTNTVTP